MQIEYLLFGIGILVLAISLFLSYRLEKKRKINPADVDGEVLKEIKKLIALSEKNIAREKFKEELENLYKLTEHKLNTTNNFVKENRARFDELLSLKDELLEFKNKTSEILQRLEEKIDSIENEYKKIYERIEESMQQIKERDDNTFRQKIEELQTNLEEIKNYIGELKNNMRTDTGENNKLNLQKKIQNTNNIEEFYNNLDKKEIYEKEINEKKEGNNNKVQEAGNNGTVMADMEITDEKQKKKFELYTKIKEMKNEGRDFEEIADKINMGVREVELFWKVNSRR